MEEQGTMSLPNSLNWAILLPSAQKSVLQWAVKGPLLRIVLVGKTHTCNKESCKKLNGGVAKVGIRDGSALVIATVAMGSCLVSVRGRREGVVEADKMMEREGE